MLSAKFIVQPLSGDVYATEFTVTNQTSGDAYTYAWDFGEQEIIYDTTNPTYIYETNGIKTITLSAIDVIGNVSTYTQTVSTEYVYRDYLTFTQIPEIYSDPGKPTTVPFKVAIITSQINTDLIVDLFATNSQSIPYEFVFSRWAFLNPTWRFLDKNSNIVTSLSVTPVPLYKNNRVVGLSGETEFYYVDSISNGDTGVNTPLLITATLQTSGFKNYKDSKVFDYSSFSNNESVRAGVLWQINDLIPDTLKITSNYLDPIPTQKWATIKIPFVVTCHGNRSLRLPGAQDSLSEIIFSYPPNNTIGNLASVFIQLSGLASTEYTVDEAPLYFQAIDKNNFRTGGYIFTTLTSNLTANNTTITAQTTTYNIPDIDPEKEFFYPAGYAPNPFVWVSNPSHKRLNKITVVPYISGSNTTIEFYKDKKILIDGIVKQVEVPSLITNSTYNYTMSGFSGIYSMAIDPRNYELIAADAELDRIYKISTLGDILSTLELSSITSLNPIENAHTPASISLDKDFNIWVSLFNSVSVLKFDKDFNLLFGTSPNNFNLDVVYEGDFIYKPPYVETDRENNCWATYSSPLCCILVKYGPAGNVLGQIVLPRKSTPSSLVVDVKNNVWVATPYYVDRYLGSIVCYSGTTFQRLTGFDVFRPENLALDRSNNLWYTFGDNRIGYFNTQSGQHGRWVLDRNSTNLNPFLPDTLITQDERKNDSTFGGLAVDVYNRVWVLDSKTNNVWLLSASPNFNQQAVRQFKVLPNTPIGYYIDVNNFTTYTLPSAQNYIHASGDWTGNKWYQKYITLQSVSATPVSGISNSFNIEPFVNNYQISKVNSEFDMAGYMQSLALPENLNSNNVFFKDFLGAVAGNSEDNRYQDIGRTIYDKIANFTDNHADIDTCGIDQLLSYAEETTTPYLDYGAELPVEIKELLDLVSIPKTKLWGIKDNIPLLQQSIGEELFPETSFITADTKIVLRNKFDGKYTVVQVPPLNGQTVYPLSEFIGKGLEQPVLIRYQFFNFNPVYTEEYIENLIDWSSERTTLSPTLSTAKDWYGDDGAIEKSFNFVLTKNIFG